MTLDATLARIGREMLVPAAALSLLVLLMPAPAEAQGLVGLRVVASQTTVRLGRDVALTALADFDDGTVFDVTALVDWSTSDAGIAAVAGGIVTGTGAGLADVRATDPGSGVQSAPLELRVVGTLLSIALTPTERILPLGQGTLYHAIGTFEQGVTLEISRDVTWVLGDPSIAHIKPNGKAKGKTPGITTVHAVDDETGVTSPTVPLRIVGSLETLDILPPSIALPLGESVIVKAQALFSSECKLLNYGSRINWKSSAPEIATVDREGVVTCHAEGNAVISVRDRRTGLTSSDNDGDGMVVCGGELVAILVTPIRYVLPVGERRDLEATYVFADGSVADGSSHVVWSSNDPGIAEITVASGKDEGEARAVAPGQAIVSAFDPVRNVSSTDPGGRDGILEVPGALTSLTITPPGNGQTLFVEPGGSRKLTARAFFDNGLGRAVNKLVSWSSSDESVVAFGDASTCAPVGTVEFVGVGTATITATYPKGGGPGAVSASVQIVVGVPGSPSGAFLDMGAAGFAHF